MNTKMLFLFFIKCLDFVASFSLGKEESFNIYSKIINDQDLEVISNFLYQKNINFFLEQPKKYFPISLLNFSNFLFLFDPLIDFFYPQKINELVFPYSLEKIEKNLNSVLKLSPVISFEEIDSNDVIFITHPSYQYLKEVLCYISEKINTNNKIINIFINANKNIYNFSEEEYNDYFHYIKEDIEKFKNKKLTDKEIEFIKENINSEQGIVFIIKNFFSDIDTENIKIFNNKDNLYITDFLFFIEWNNILANKIVILSPDPFSYLVSTQYLLEKEEVLKVNQRSENVFFLNYKMTNVFEIQEKKKQNITKLFILCNILNLISNFFDYELIEEI